MSSGMRMAVLTVNRQQPQKCYCKLKDDTWHPCAYRNMSKEKQCCYYAAASGISARTSQLFCS